MAIKERVEEILRVLNPKLEELAGGYVEFMGFDETSAVLSVKTYGGRLL